MTDFTDSTRPSFSLEQSAYYLRHLQYLKRELMLLQAALLPAVPEWRMKQLLGLHQWQDSLHVNEMRIRLQELRYPRPDKDLQPVSHHLRRWIETAPDNRMVAYAIYASVKPQLLAVYEELLTHVFPVHDAPTCRLLRHMQQEEREQIRGAAACETIEELVPNRSPQLRNWYAAFDEAVRKLFRRLFQQTPFPDEDEPEQLYRQLQSIGADAPALPAAHAARPPACAVVDTIPAAEHPTDQEKVIHQFTHYVQEMMAAETIGSVMYEIQGMPWEFYFDLSRHLWDEVRHSHMGELRLQELGLGLDEIVYLRRNYGARQLMDPISRYALLTYILEAGAFPYKHMSYREHVEKRDFNSAQAFLYDITDETMHVHYGRKWVPELIARAGLSLPADQLAADAETKYEERLRLYSAAG